MFVSVGSRSNVDDADTHPAEFHRANILEYTPEGKFVKIYGAGIRNPVGIAVHPRTGELWCSVNERDGLGDNLVPDYITHVQEDGFYGWPWYYMGSNQDPRHEGKHPELKGKVTVPDVLLQPHFASLEMTFYTGKQFPAEFHGDVFASEHGSWNRKYRAGYEVIRVPVKDGRATGEFEDFLTGFVTAVWAGVGPPGRRCGRAGRFIDRLGRRLELALAGQLQGQLIPDWPLWRALELDTDARAPQPMAGFDGPARSFSLSPAAERPAPAPARACRVRQKQRGHPRRCRTRCAAPAALQPGMLPQFRLPRRPESGTETRTCR